MPREKRRVPVRRDPVSTRGHDGKIKTAEERGRPDRGPDGLAAVLRLSEIKESKVIGTSVKRIIADPTNKETYPLDYYERVALLSDRQVNAGRRLALYFSKAFGHPKLTNCLVEGPGGSTLSEERAEKKSFCRRAYDEAMAPLSASLQVTLTLQEVVRGEWPKRLHGLQYLREGLSHLADFWGFDRDGQRTKGEKS